MKHKKYKTVLGLFIMSLFPIGIWAILTFSLFAIKTFLVVLILVFAGVLVGRFMEENY